MYISGDLKFYNHHLVYNQFLNFYAILYRNNYSKLTGFHGVNTLAIYCTLL